MVVATYALLARADRSRSQVTQMMPTIPATEARVRTVFRWLLGAMLLFTGTSHLTWARTEFQAQVPDAVPMNKDLVVILSGIVELLFSMALITLERRRVTVGWFVGAFFVAIFPGNISQYLNHR